MELDYSNEQDIEDDEAHCAPHNRFMGYTENDVYPTPSFAGFISALIILMIFAVLLSAILP